MLPKLPLVLINGSEGPSSGFKQVILPRNPKEIQKYIEYYLKKPDVPVKPFKNKPHFEGFKGTVTQGEESNKWIISGVCTRKHSTVTITELPIGYSLKSYKKILNKLVDTNKIQSYTENCVDSFHFEVKISKTVLDKLDDEQLLDYLKLNKKVSELYVVMDEKNRVQVFNSVNDIMQKYIQVKKYYLRKRKDYLINSLVQDIKILISKYIFIKSIIDETLIITKRPTEDIITDLDNLDKVIKVDDNYDYLLNMSIRSMTEERMQKLMDQIKGRKTELDFVKSSSIEEMWLKDLGEK
jgi:DNA topoisomerase-2